MSLFLTTQKLDLSKAAREKITSGHWRTLPSGQMAVLFYFHKSTQKSATGEILSLKEDQFGWGAHRTSDISKGDIWDIEGLQFVIQDGRWEEDDRLRLDVLEGQFRMVRL